MLEDGRIAEFDAPKTLFQDEGGAFRFLVDEDEERDELYTIFNTE